MGQNFGYNTVYLILNNQWIILLIFSLSIFIIIKTLKLINELQFNWRSCLFVIFIILFSSVTTRFYLYK